MNNTILNTFQSIAELLGWTILHSIWQITLIALLLKLLLHWTSKHDATIRYGLSMSALLAIVAWSAYTFTEGIPHNIFQENTVISSDTESVSTSVIIVSSPVALYQQMSDKVKILVAPIVPTLAVLWFLGIAFFASRILTGFFKLHQLSRVGIQALPSTWEPQLERLKQLSGISRIVDVHLSTMVSAPITYKFFRPIILLPISLFSGLSDEQIEVLILHELAHIKRHDYLFNLLQSTIEVVFFYHPLVWWISKNVRSEREHCCDDMVMNIRHQPMLYAQTLTQIQVQHYSLKTKLAMSAKHNTGDFSKRIYRLFQQKDPYSKLRNSAAALLLLLLSGGMMAFYPSHSLKATNLNTPIIVLDSIPPSTQKQETITLKQEVIKRETTAAALQAQLIALEKELHKNTKALKEEEVEDKAKKEELKVKAAQLKQELNQKVTELKSLSESSSSLQLNSFKKELVVLKMMKDKKPLILIDSKPYTNFEIDEEGKLTLDIPTDKIHTINVLKGEKAIEKFGEQATDGVVEIFTKENTPKENSSDNVLKGKVEGNHFTYKSTTNKQPLLVLNGKVLSQKEGEDITKIEDISPDDIGHMNVIKGEAALKKYGAQGKDGVVEVYTKGNEPAKEKANKKIILNGDVSKSEVEKEEHVWIQANDQFDKKSPLFVIDGKKMPIKSTKEETIGDINPEEIATMKVIKGKAALDKYGEEGINGVVEITTKSFAKKHPKDLKKKKEKKEKKKYKTAKKEKKTKKEKAEKSLLKSKMPKTSLPGLSVYPNPTRKLTNVQLNLEQKGNVKVDIINVNGQLVFNLVNEVLDKGLHEFQWNSDDQPSGNYFVHFNMNGTLISKQVVVKK